MITRLGIVLLFIVLSGGCATHRPPHHDPEAMVAVSGYVVAQRTAQIQAEVTDAVEHHTLSPQMQLYITSQLHTVNDTGVQLGDTLKAIDQAANASAREPVRQQAIMQVTAIKNALTNILNTVQADPAQATVTSYVRDALSECDQMIANLESDS